MPTYRSISVVFNSQHDTQILPEFCPVSSDNTVPALVDEATSTCSVHIPADPGCAFWINYRVLPPVPADHYFLFRLYINGAHIANWSTGKAEKWKGKTMFALYERAEDEEGKKGVEKRMFCFDSPPKEEKGMRGKSSLSKEKNFVEIKVHRAHGRKRVERELQEYKKTHHAKSPKGINLVDAGSAASGHPKRFYKFALIDPVDQPFATFRYYYLSWVQLHELKLIEVGRETVGEENDLSIIEPDEGSVRDSGDSAHQPSLPEDDSFHDCDVEAKHSVERQRPTLTTRVEQSTDDADKVEHSIYIPQDTIGQALSTNQRHSGAGTPPEYYRPSTSSSARPGAVSVDSDYSPTAYQPHPVFPGLTSDSNSGKPLEDVSGKSLLPVSRKQGGIMSGSSLADTISSIWTRRNNTTEARGRKETSKDGE